MTTDAEYEKIQTDKINELKPLLTDEFLSTLVESVKTCAWDVDFIESCAFVKWCHQVAGKEMADFKEHDYHK